MSVSQLPLFLGKQFAFCELTCLSFLSHYTNLKDFLSLASSSANFFFMDHCMKTFAARWLLRKEDCCLNTSQTSQPFQLFS